MFRKLMDGEVDAVEFYENPVKTRTGEERLIAWHNAHQRDASGRIIGTLSSGDDITERNRTEEELVRHRDHLESLVAERTEELRRYAADLTTANRELEAFTYSVSHDLRAPLRAIDGFSEILKEEKSNQLDEEGHRFLGIVRDNAALMGTLIDHLVELSRIGRRGLDITSLDMDSQVQVVVEELEGADAGRERTVTVGRLPTAYGDATLLRQVWTNLLSIAFKFSSGSHPSVVAVEGCVEGNESVYSDRVNGAGFEMRDSWKLFDVFERLHSREEFEGTGAGLAIVERVVNRLGGRVWGEGEVGVGATFWFTLPRRDQRSERPGGLERGFDGKDGAP